MKSKMTTLMLALAMTTLALLVSAPTRASYCFEVIDQACNYSNGDTCFYSACTFQTTCSGGGQPEGEPLWCTEEWNICCR